MAREKKEPYSPTGRLDDLITTLEQSHKTAHEMFDSYIEELRAQIPGIPFGVMKQTEILGRAGHSLNYIDALKMLREKFTRP